LRRVASSEATDGGLDGNGPPPSMPDRSSRHPSRHPRGTSHPGTSMVGPPPVTQVCCSARSRDRRNTLEHHGWGRCGDGASQGVKLPPRGGSRRPTPTPAFLPLRATKWPPTVRAGREPVPPSPDTAERGAPALRARIRGKAVPGARCSICASAGPAQAPTQCRWSCAAPTTPQGGGDLRGGQPCRAPARSVASRAERPRARVQAASRLSRHVERKCRGTHSGERCAATRADVFATAFGLGWPGRRVAQHPRLLKQWQTLNKRSVHGT